MSSTYLCVIVSASGILAYRSSSRYTVLQQRGASLPSAASADGELSSGGSAPPGLGAALGAPGPGLPAPNELRPAAYIGVWAPSFSEL